MLKPFCCLGGEVANLFTFCITNYGESTTQSTQSLVQSDAYPPSVDVATGYCHFFFVFFWAGDTEAPNQSTSRFVTFMIFIYSYSLYHHIYLSSLPRWFSALLLNWWISPVVTGFPSGACMSASMEHGQFAGNFHSENKVFPHFCQRDLLGKSGFLTIHSKVFKSRLLQDLTEVIAQKFYAKVLYVLMRFSRLLDWPNGLWRR